MISAFSLIHRLWLKIQVQGDPDACWPWGAATSLSGRRRVRYGVLREGGEHRRLWRAHRLVLILKTSVTDVPRDDDEPFLTWLRRAARYYDHLEASHTCDFSLCCNPRHLVWELHGDNVKNQTRRRRQSRHAHPPEEAYDAAV